MENIFKLQAQMNKAQKLFLALPQVPSTPATRSATANMLRKFSDSDRAAYAKHAGVNTPSNTSWSLFVSLLDGNDGKIIIK